jgi:hypothetical protein
MAKITMIGIKAANHSNPAHVRNCAIILLTLHRKKLSFAVMVVDFHRNWIGEK